VLSRDRENGIAFPVKIHATTDNVNDTTDTSFSGTNTIVYSGPAGGLFYTSLVTFVSGVATNSLAVTNAQTTTISATATGAMTPIASSSLQVNPKLVVTLPGETFTSGQATNNGNSGTPSVQTAGVSFNLTSLTAANADNTIDTAFTGNQFINYFGPATNASSGGGTPTYTTSVNFSSGVSTTPLATILVDAQTTTITATNYTVVTGVASSSLKVVAGGAAQIGFVAQTAGGQPGAAWNAQPAVALEDVAAIGDGGAGWGGDVGGAGERGGW